MGVQQTILKRTYTTEVGGKTFTNATGALALGVPGNIFDASPARIHTDTLASETPVTIGTYVAGKGVIVNPREYALVGEAGNPLAPSLTLAPGDAASFMTFGHVVVRGDEVGNIIAAQKMSGKVIIGSDWWTKVVADSTSTFKYIPATAEDFSASKAYAAGDFVKQADKIWMFKVAHDAGAWTGTDATDTTGTTTTDWPGTDATAGNLYKFWGDTCVVVELNGFA